MVRRLVAALASTLLVAGLAPALDAGATSGTVTGSKPHRFTVTASLHPASITLGDKAKISGRVKPVRQGDDVLVQRKKAATWVTVSKRPMKKDGSFSYTFEPASVGNYVYRARMPRTGTVTAANSPARALTVTEAPDPSLIVFTIAADTGAGSWNTSGTRVSGEVGQTLRIVNADTVAHRLHTDGNPFPHPATDIAPGTSADYPLLTAFSGDSLYDHDHGPLSRFYITVTDPG